MASSTEDQNANYDRGIKPHELSRPGEFLEEAYFQIQSQN